MNLISVKDQLPAEDQDVIVWNGSQLAAAKYVKRNVLVSQEPYVTEMRGQFQVEKYAGTMDRSIISNWATVTHWMPAKIEDPNGNS